MVSPQAERRDGHVLSTALDQLQVGLACHRQVPLAGAISELRPNVASVDLPACWVYCALPVRRVFSTKQIVRLLCAAWIGIHFAAKAQSLSLAETCIGKCTCTVRF